MPSWKLSKIEKVLAGKSLENRHRGKVFSVQSEDGQVTMKLKFMGKHENEFVFSLPATTKKTSRLIEDSEDLFNIKVALVGAGIVSFLGSRK